jgi:ATP-binding cassette subfamily C (CFTR/MRP) protein 1
MAMGSLLYAEHRYSYSPSMLLSLYLSITILLDIAIVRSLFLRGDLNTVAAVASAAVSAKLVILVLEEVPKRGSTTTRTSKELSSGLWNRSVFWWLNSTLRRGFKSFLGMDDLSSLDHQLDSRFLASRINQTWESGTSSTFPHLVYIGSC